MRPADEHSLLLTYPSSVSLAQFVRLTCQAYNILRKNARMIVTLFSLMLSCGIPQLRTENGGWPGATRYTGAMSLTRAPN